MAKMHRQFANNLSCSADESGYGSLGFSVSISIKGADANQGKPFF